MFITLVITFALNSNDNIFTHYKFVIQQSVYFIKNEINTSWKNYAIRYITQENNDNTWEVIN